MDNFIGLPASIDLNIKGVQAQTEIYLASRIPWDNAYKHVRAYASENDLLNKVKSLIPSEDFHITRSAPVRVGSLNVVINANEALAMNLNYMAFKNMPYENKWHFAFITNVSWASSESVNIEFELDIFAECYYSTRFLPCFIERMHIPKSEDKAGANVVPDDLETGTMECYHHSSIPYGTMKIGLYVTEMPNGDEPAGTNHLFNGVYSGLISASYDVSDYQTVNELIQMYNDNGKDDAITMIYMFPNICQNSSGSPESTVFYMDIDLEFPYSPKNQKLFTYPYVYCICDDNAGNVNIYKPELFSGDKYEFKASGLRCTLPAVYVVPTNYNGLSEDHSHSFITNNFPICAWSSDTFKAWVAQNKNSLALGIISQTGGAMIKGVSGALKGGAIGSLAGGAGAIGGTVAGGVSGAVSGLSNVANTLATIYDKEVLPNQARGKVGSENVRTAMNLNRVDVYAVAPKASMCKVIDDYWSAFGYPIHQIRTPNINSRSSWNYIKTVDCGFQANAELSMLAKYRKIFDDGVTIWHTDDIGNYNLSNN